MVKNKNKNKKPATSGLLNRRRYPKQKWSNLTKYVPSTMRVHEAHWSLTNLANQCRHKNI